MLPQRDCYLKRHNYQQFESFYTPKNNIQMQQMMKIITITVYVQKEIGQ